MWTCKKCKEKHDNEFDACWKCGYDKSGREQEVKEERRKGELNELSKKYKSLRTYQYLLYIVIVIQVIGAFGIGSEMSGDEFSVLYLLLLGISIWFMLQYIKMITFLFDLSEQKADISHKH